LHFFKIYFAILSSDDKNFTDVDQLTLGRIKFLTAKSKRGLIVME